MRTAHGSFWFRLLLAFYFPFLALLVLGIGGLIAYLVALLADHRGVRILLFVAIAILGLTLVQVLWATRVLWSLPPRRDEMELRLPRQRLRGLYDLVAEVAQQRRLPMPQEIRLAADTVAHVYEDTKGKEILVVGGPAIGILSREALAGVVAHELAHFAAGDARLSRRGHKRSLMIELLEYRFASQGGSNLNPLVWLLRLYHLLYNLAWAADSRAREYAADRHIVAQVGKEAAAASLIHLTLTERLPGVRLSGIAEACLATGEPLHQIFAEQRQRAEGTDAYDWEEALRKELKGKTELFDSHPGLRDRLAALGVSPRKALKLALDLSGPPARELFPDWDKIEEEMTERLMIVYRENYLAKREMAQIFLGRPLDRP
jgi:Zn-dependent protease with chaperone function